MQSQDERRGGHLRAGVPGGDERVGLPLGLQADADGHRRLGLAPDRDRRLVGHLDHVGRIDDLETRRRFGQGLVFAPSSLEVFKSAVDGGLGLVLTVVGAIAVALGAFGNSLKKVTIEHTLNAFQNLINCS